MITVKRLFCIAFACLLCFPLSACSSTEPPQSPLEQLHDVLQSEESVEEKDYRIVLPSDATSALAIAARSLAESLSEQTGVGATVWYEHERGCFEGSVQFLLLGWCERAQAEMRTFKSEDYLCRMCKDGSVLLGGKTESATLTAIERFEEEILPAASSTGLMHEEAGFLYVAEYSVEEFCLNGFELQEYKIVLEENADHLLAVARWLQKEIEQTSGYCLSMIDWEEFDGKGRAIFLELAEQNEQNSQAHIVPNEKGIHLLGRDVYGISVAAQTFVSELTRATSDSLSTLEIKEKTTLPYEYAELFGATMCVEHLLPLDEPSKLHVILDSMQEHQEEWLLIDRMPEQYVHYFEEISGNSTFHTVQTETEDLIPIFQNKMEFPQFLSTYPTECEGLFVTEWKIGAESAIRMLVIAGKIEEDRTINLSEILAKSTLPTVVVVHTQNEDAVLSLEGLQESGLTLLLDEQYQTDKIFEKQRFSVYARAVSVESTAKDNTSGYRSFHVRRLWAIDSLAE